MMVTTHQCAFWSLRSCTTQSESRRRCQPVFVVIVSRARRTSGWGVSAGGGGGGGASGGEGPPGPPRLPASPRGVLRRAARSRTVQGGALPLQVRSPDALCCVATWPSRFGTKPGI